MHRWALFAWRPDVQHAIPVYENELSLRSLRSGPVAAEGAWSQQRGRGITEHGRSTHPQLCSRQQLETRGAVTTSTLPQVHSFLLFPFSSLWQIGFLFLTLPSLPGVEFHVCLFRQVALQCVPALPRQEWVQNFSCSASMLGVAMYPEITLGAQPLLSCTHQ